MSEMEQEHTPLWDDDAIHQWLQATLGKEKIRNASDAVKYGRSAVSVIAGEYEAALAAARSEQAQRIEQLEAEVARLSRRKQEER